jgi:hypothetical protein
MALRGWPDHPLGHGGGPATPNGKKIKNENGFWAFEGWPDRPQGPGGGPYSRSLGGGPATPKSPKPIFVFFFFWPFGGGQTTPLAMALGGGPVTP